MILAALRRKYNEKVGLRVSFCKLGSLEQNRPLVPEYDSFGIIIEESLNREDPWKTRVAIAKAFGAVSQYMGEAEVSLFFDVLIGDAALGDRSPDVRGSMLAVCSPY